MCSSPKSSGSSRPKITAKGFTASLNTDALSRFAECANAADTRRQARTKKPKKPHRNGGYGWT